MNRIVWITGGSSGIGAALVKKYSDSGYYVIATARSKGQLEKVASSSNCPENIKIFPADLEKVNELSKIIQSVWNIFDGIDLVILNAGIGQWGEVKDTEMSVERKIFELNFWSPVQSIKLLIPKMENKGSGKIICVGSIASQFGQAKLAAYSASKSALTLYLESLKEELRYSKVKVKLVSPGNIKTSIMKSALTHNGKKLNKVGRAQEKGMTTQKLAKKIFKFEKQEKFHKFFTGIEGLAVLLHKFSPKLFYYIYRNLSRRKK